MTLTDAEKKYAIIAAAVLLALILVWRWWSSGDIEAVTDIKDASEQMAADVNDIVQKAKKQEENTRVHTITEIQALRNDDIAAGLEALLRSYRSGS